MNDTVYIVIASGGQWDHAWTDNLFAVSNEQLAISEVERLTENHRRLSEIYNAANSYIYNLFNEIQLIEYPPKPRGPAISNREKMLAYSIQMAEWEKMCKPISEENTRIQRDRNLDMHQKMTNKLRELGATEKDYAEFRFNPLSETNWGICYNTDQTFTYEKINVIG